jgi:hypothetical protein
LIGEFDKKAVAIEGAGGGGFGRGGGGGGGRGGAPAGPPTLSSIGGSLTTLMTALQGADVSPTTQLTAEVMKQRAEVGKLMDRWNALKGADLAALNAKLKAVNLPEVAMDAPAPPATPRRGRGQ